MTRHRLRGLPGARRLPGAQNPTREADRRKTNSEDDRLPEAAFPRGSISANGATSYLDHEMDLPDGGSASYQVYDERAGVKSA